MARHSRSDLFERIAYEYVGWYGRPHGISDLVWSDPWAGVTVVKPHLMFRMPSGTSIVGGLFLIAYL